MYILFSICVAIKLKGTETRWNTTGTALPILDNSTGEIKEYSWGCREWVDGVRLYVIKVPPPEKIQTVAFDYYCLMKS